MKQSKTDSDRTVHATSAVGRLEMVRYDRAGKWYIEGTLPKHGPRASVTVKEAIDIARRWARSGGTVNYGLPGGQVFDRGVRA